MDGGGGHSAFSSPCRASGQSSRAGGTAREPTRFWSEILADKSGLAAIGIRPQQVTAAGRVCTVPRGALTCLGARGRWPPRMRRARSRPPGLQFPEDFAGGRRRPAAGAILKSDPQSLSLCVSRRRPPEDRELSPLKREGVEDSAAGGRDSWRRHGGFGARPAPLSLSILLRHFLAAASPRGGAGHSGTQSPRAGVSGAPLQWAPHRVVPCQPEASEAGDGTQPSASERSPSSRLREARQPPEAR